jgi:hypothetical protein
LNNGDPNMDTIFRWSRDFPRPRLLPSHIKRNHYKLVEIVDVVGYCIGREFDEDVKIFRARVGSLVYSVEDVSWLVQGKKK